MNTRRTFGLLVVIIAAAVFWRTAYPTITWWDSSEYSTAAGTLGIISAPGSLLLTLLGWPIAHLPLGSSPAHLLNLFAGVLAAITVGLVFLLALRMLAPPHVVAALGLAPPYSHSRALSTVRSASRTCRPLGVSPRAPIRTRRGRALAKLKQSSLPS